MAAAAIQTEIPLVRRKQFGYQTLCAIARRVSDATDAVVVGGVAAMLHGGTCYLSKVEIYTEARWTTHLQLESAGIMWNAVLRSHTIEGISVQMVHDLRVPPGKPEILEGVRVLSLSDLMSMKLWNGLNLVNHHDDFAEIIDLITRIPLKKDFAAKLPTKLRAPFKELVEQVHGSRGSPVPPMTPKAYFDKYGSARRRAAI